MSPSCAWEFEPGTGQRHDSYVRYFWSEDEEDRQPPVRRKTIRAYINRAHGQADPSKADAAGREIYKTYSDYAHARSAPIMAMVHGPPARFELNGVHDREAKHPFALQHPTYFYRCLVSACLVSNVVLPPEQSSRAYAEVKEFEAKHKDLLF